MKGALFKNLFKIIKMNIFTQKINPLSGQTEWEFQNEDYDYHQEVARSAFADMLHDTERNQKYFIALKDAVKKMHDVGKKANVLDIGTGTGLLSMMAVKCGADTVVACEAFKPMSECASKIIRDNDMHNHIQLISKRSTDLTVGENGDMKQKANILVTEVFDTELIGEGAISTFTHAHKVLLEKDCIVVPSSGTIWAQVVESPLAQNWNRLKLVADIDGVVLLNTPDNIVNCSGAAAVHDIQLSQIPPHSFNSLSNPIPVLKFDWSVKMPLLSERFNVHVLKAERTGTAQMVFMWWDLNMDTEGKVILSCAPYWAHPDIKSLVQQNPQVEYKQDLIPWRDHWMQAVYYLPQAVNLKKDNEFTLISCHDEYSLWFNLREDLKLSDNDYLRPICECGVHVAHSRTRIGQMNDGTRMKKYLNALGECVDSNSVCLCLSDGSLLGLIALKLGAKHVYYFERNTLLRRILDSYIEHNELKDKVTVIDNIDELKKRELGDVNLILGEPNFTTSLLPWDNFYFWHLKGELKDKLNPNVKALPIGATIKAMAVELKDLYKIRASLGYCEGFNMKRFDDLIEDACIITDSSVEPQPLWEYPCKALTKTIELLKLDFTQTEKSESSGNFNIQSGSGTCNGIAIWVDWDLNGNRKNIITTGPVIPPEVGQRVTWDMYSRQGIYLMSNLKPVDENCTIDFTVEYNAASKNIHFTFNVNQQSNLVK